MHWMVGLPCHLVPPSVSPHHRPAPSMPWPRALTSLTCAPRPCHVDAGHHTSGCAAAPGCPQVEQVELCGRERRCRAVPAGRPQGPGAQRILLQHAGARGRGRGRAHSGSGAPPVHHGRLLRWPARQPELRGVGQPHSDGIRWGVGRGSKQACTGWLNRLQSSCTCWARGHVYKAGGGGSSCILCSILSSHKYMSAAHKRPSCPPLQHQCLGLPACPSPPPPASSLKQAPGRHPWPAPATTSMQAARLPRSSAAAAASSPPRSIPCTARQCTMRPPIYAQSPPTAHSLRLGGTLAARRVCRQAAGLTQATAWRLARTPQTEAQRSSATSAGGEPAAWTLHRVKRQGRMQARQRALPSTVVHGSRRVEHSTVSMQPLTARRWPCAPCCRPALQRSLRGSQGALWAAHGRRL